MIIVSGKVVVAEGVAEKLRGEMETVIAATRAEAGCIDYRYGTDVLEPNVILVLEYWENWDALKAHGQAPHMKSWGAAMTAAGIVSRDLSAVEVDAAKMLKL